MKVKRAGEIMISLKEYPHIAYWFTLRQAAAAISQFEMDTPGGRSIPRVVLVFDKEYRLVGMVRRQDILRGLEPESLLDKLLSYSSRLLGRKASPDQADAKLAKAMRERAERPVSDVMLPVTLWLDYDDPIIKVVHEMVEKDLVLLTVLKEGKAVGVVEIVNVFEEIAKMLMG